MPSTLKHPTAAGRPRERLVVALLVVAAIAGCVGREAWLAQRGLGVYPPAPQVPRVVALGTLRGGPPPSDGEVKLSQFLFGVEPPPPLTIANPLAVAVDGDHVLVCDAALDTVFVWDAGADQIAETTFGRAAESPYAVAALPDGSRIVCDAVGVRRWRGKQATQIYTLPSEPLKAGGALPVDDTLWVTNLRLHRIERFDLETAEYLGSIGQRGATPGEFALPRGMARTPGGHIAVVDMLNNRVQVFRPDGELVQIVGQPGDTPGAFGRPKDVAVGPDGTYFVTDAFSQRVHTFSADGTPLMAFGEPGSGVGALTLPSGIAISERAPSTQVLERPAEEPLYYVLVGEQLAKPGVRAYAWYGTRLATDPVPAAAFDAPEQTPRTTSVLNPHWKADSCDGCHTVQNGQVQPIEPALVDNICLSCHDGVQAPADPHPIGRPANTDAVQSPDDWPTVDGLIGCVTCHDIIRHCDRDARRPAMNSVLLRGYDPQQPLDYCSICHVPEQTARFSPHRQRDAQGRVRDDACMFCHTQRPEIPPDGTRQFEPHLRVATSDLCLNCHSPHWDLSPEGHVDRPVTPRIREWMIVRELQRERSGTAEELLDIARQSGRQPARLPLGEGMVTCYTCHNPHYAGMFAPDTELGALAENPTDRGAALRTDWIELCSECHHR
jgi:sugar lactone lactonase YvrE